MGGPLYGNILIISYWWGKCTHRVAFTAAFYMQKESPTARTLAPQPLIMDVFYTVG